MHPTRKSSGSSAFLNRLQRNAQFGVESASQSEPAAQDTGLSPEALLSVLDGRSEWTVGALAESVSAEPEALAAALEELLGAECILLEGSVVDPGSRITITEVGRKTANFVKITSAR